MNHQRIKDALLTPQLLGERWLARLAVRAVITRERQRLGTRSIVGSVTLPPPDHSRRVTLCVSVV